jgi:hypothetical protein
VSHLVNLARMKRMVLSLKPESSSGGGRSSVVVTNAVPSLGGGVRCQGLP